MSTGFKEVGVGDVFLLVEGGGVDTTGSRSLSLSPLNDDDREIDCRKEEVEYGNRCSSCTTSV